MTGIDNAMHEVVTLQFGQQANYLGTHYWNVQESYFTYAGQEESPVDHDISFRPGIGSDGADTYTPRTLIYDLKGGFGTLRQENALYEIQNQVHPSQQGPWSGSTIPLQLPPIAPSSYQQALDQGTQPPQLTTETVRFWSDYNHIFYHPRSIVQLNEYELNSSLLPFERWQTGEELFANLDREHDLLDRDLRPFLEECDQLQALQVFASVDNAWGGFAARYLERIADDHGKGLRWIFGLQDGKPSSRDRHTLQLSNLSQSIYSLDANCSMHIPLTSIPSLLPPYVTINGPSLWHTSALQVAAMESLTLPTRLRSLEAGRTTFDQLETALNNDGNRRLGVATMSIDDPSHLQDEMDLSGERDTRMTNGLDEDDEDNNSMLDISMLPNVARLSSTGGRRLGRREHLFSRIESLRGQWKSAAEIESSNYDSRDPFSHGWRVNTFQSQLLFPILSSYPPIVRFTARPESLAIRAALSTTTVVADEIRNLERSARRIVGLEEREALCEGLSRIAEEYEEGWSGSDDSDDND